MEENLSTSNSENKGGEIKKFILLAVKILVFIALLVPFIKYMGAKYKVASTENLINGYNQSRWEEFYSLPENSLDTVFLGSSHSYCTFDPEVFDAQTGTNSYQMGMPLQHYDSTYFTLLEVLKFQKPKYAVVEVYWDMLDDDFELKQAGMLFQVLDNDDLEKRYIDEVFPLGEKIKYNTDVLKYQADYFAYKTTDIKKRTEERFGVHQVAAERQQGTEKYRSKGYTFCDYHMLPSEMDKTNQFRKFDGKDWSASPVQEKWIGKIAETCRENGIKLIFVTAPIANVSMDYIKNYDKVHDHIQKLADKYDVPYYDYNVINKEENLLTLDNFRDDAHLNDSGVQIVSKHFANIFKETLI